MEQRAHKDTAKRICAPYKKTSIKEGSKQETDSSKTKIQKNLLDFCAEPTNQKPRNEWKGYFESEDLTSNPELKTPIPEKKSQKPKTTSTTLSEAPFKKWDETYTRILHCIKDNHTISSISKVLSIPRSTIRDRLHRLEQKEIITKTDTILLGNKHTTFIITNGWALKLVNGGQVSVVNKPNVPKTESVKFARHCVSLQAEIISGTIPKGDKSYSPNGWTGEIFEGDGTYTIRVIPNRNGTARAVVDIFISLGASSPADLTMKYHTFAERYLGSWAEKNSLKLGQITEYRMPHTSVEGSRGLAQTILGAIGGETKFKDKGIQVDKSDKEHQGEIEFHDKKGEESLRNFEFALNQSPEKMEHLASKFDALRETLHDEVKKVGSGISDIQGFLILQRENDLLREQNQLLREQMSELTKQVNEMKTMLGLNPPHQDSPKKSKYDGIGVYG